MSHYRTQFDRKSLLPPIKNPYEVLATHRPVSGGVLAFARSRGETLGTTEEPNLPDLSGLILEQEGLTYVVNQRQLTYKKEVGRPAKKRHWGVRREGTNNILTDFGSRVDVPHVGKFKSVEVDLDVFDEEGNLISKTTYESQKDFLEFLDHHAPESDRKKLAKQAKNGGFGLPRHLMTKAGNQPLPMGKINIAGWANIPKPAAELKPDERTVTRYPKPAADKDWFEEAFAQREQLYLPGESWVGLTLKTGKGNKLQITQDALLYSPHGADTRIVRTWEITEYDKDGNQLKQEKRTFRDNELREFIEENKKSFTDLYWEIPNSIIKDARRVARLGRIAVGAKGPHIGSRHLGYDESFEVLSAPDIHEEDIVKEKVWQHKQDKLARKVAKSLRDTIAEHGTVPVLELAERMRNDYLFVAEQLGLKVPKEDAESISWALWDIAEQRYFAENPDEAEPIRHTNKYGIKVGDPMSSPRTSKRKQREIVDIEIGFAFIDNILKPVFDGEPVNIVNTKGFVEQELKAKLGFQVNPRLVSLLSEFVKAEVTGIIKSTADELVEKQDTYFNPIRDEVPANLGDFKKAMELVNAAKLARLGRLLRREYKQ